MHACKICKRSFVDNMNNLLDELMPAGCGDYFEQSKNLTSKDLETGDQFWYSGIYCVKGQCLRCGEAICSGLPEKKTSEPVYRITEFIETCTC